jgi:hypothetical protein
MNSGAWSCSARNIPGIQLGRSSRSLLLFGEIPERSRRRAFCPRPLLKSRKGRWRQFRQHIQTVALSKAADAQWTFLASL